MHEKIFSINNKKGVLIVYIIKHKRVTLLPLSKQLEKLQHLPSLLKGETFCIFAKYTLTSVFGPQMLKGTVTPLNMIESSIIL